MHQEKQYTPGPWSVDDCRYGFAIHAKTGAPVVTTEDDEGRFGTIASEADARLIAAAPDLLEALIGVMTVADRATQEFDKARAAISKALGA